MPRTAWRTDSGAWRAGVVFPNGFGALTEDAFVNDFANGVEPDVARVLYAARPRLGRALPRQDDRGGLAVQTSLVRGHRAGRHDFTRARTVPAEAHGCNDSRDRRRASVADQPSREVAQVVTDAVQAVQR